MVLVLRLGKVPIQYTARITTMAFIVTFVLYASAFLLPFLISWGTGSFIGTMEAIAEVPTVIGQPNINLDMMSFEGSADYDSVFSLPKASESKGIIPIIEHDRRANSQFLSLNVYYPVGLHNVTRISVQFPFTVQFEASDMVFDGIIDEEVVVPNGFTQLDIVGALAFSQSLAINGASGTNVKLSSDFLQNAETLDIPLNASAPSVTGTPRFVRRSAIFGTCEHDEYFALHVNMRVPLVKIIRERKGWNTFIDIWTQYISMFVPFLFIVQIALEALFKSGFVPVNAQNMAEVDPVKIPKFNR